MNIHSTSTFVHILDCPALGEPLRYKIFHRHAVYLVLFGCRNFGAIILVSVLNKAESGFDMTWFDQVNAPSTQITLLKRKP